MSASENAMTIIRKISGKGSARHTAMGGVKRSHLLSFPRRCDPPDVCPALRWRGVSVLASARLKTVSSGVSTRQKDSEGLVMLGWWHVCESACEASLCIWDGLVHTVGEMQGLCVQDG